MKQVLSNSWTCIYSLHKGSVIVRLLVQGNGDCLTLVVGGRQAGVFAGFLFLEEQVLSNPWTAS